jgi:hypothetical protein
VEKQLVKKSYDIQSLILCSIIALLIIIPLALLTISFKNIGMLIILIVFIVLSILSLMLIYFHTSVQIIFQKSEIIFKKKNKEIKRFKWNEIKIEYLGIDELFFLKCFCIQLSYYDRREEKYIDILIPNKEEEFIKIMSLRKNND